MLHRNVERTPLVTLVLPAMMLAGLALCAVIASAPRAMVSSERDPTKVQVTVVAYRWYASWAVQTGAGCPDDLGELARVVGAEREDIEDAWGAPLRFACKPAWFGVWSLGPDGLDGTGDEITSWDWMRHRAECPPLLLDIARSINAERHELGTSARVVCEHDPKLDVWFLRWDPKDADR